jgi:hypothetical protein
MYTLQSKPQVKQMNQVQQPSPMQARSLSKETNAAMPEEVEQTHGVGCLKLNAAGRQKRSSLTRKNIISGLFY